MSRFVTHIHTIYSLDGSNNPGVVLRNAQKNDVYAEIVAHNSFLWTRKYPEVFKSERIIPGVEFRIRGVDVVASGPDVGEIGKDRKFSVYGYPAPKNYDLPLEEALESLRECSEYVYFPHPAAELGVALSGQERLISKADGVEVWNGSAALLPGANKAACVLADKYGKAKLAGLDDHYGCNGTLPAYNFIEASSKDDVYDAVRKGTTEPYVSPMFPLKMSKEYALLACRALKDLRQVSLDASSAGRTRRRNA
jgi:predicted metal-dependent phosphoesterase TrpH